MTTRKQNLRDAVVNSDVDATAIEICLKKNPHWSFFIKTRLLDNNTCSHLCSRANKRVYGSSKCQIERARFCFEYIQTSFNQEYQHYPLMIKMIYKCLQQLYIMSDYQNAHGLKTEWSNLRIDILFTLPEQHHPSKESARDSKLFHENLNLETISDLTLADCIEEEEEEEFERYSMDLQNLKYDDLSHTTIFTRENHENLRRLSPVNLVVDNFYGCHSKIVEHYRDIYLFDFLEFLVEFVYEIVHKYVELHSDDTDENNPILLKVDEMFSPNCCYPIQRIYDIKQLQTNNSFELNHKQTDVYDSISLMFENEYAFDLNQQPLAIDLVRLCFKFLGFPVGIQNVVELLKTHLILSASCIDTEGMEENFVKQTHSLEYSEGDSRVNSHLLSISEDCSSSSSSFAHSETEAALLKENWNKWVGVSMLKTHELQKRNSSSSKLFSTTDGKHSSYPTEFVDPSETNVNNDVEREERYVENLQEHVNDSKLSNESGGSWNNAREHSDSRGVKSATNKESESVRNGNRSTRFTFSSSSGSKNVHKPVYKKHMEKYFSEYLSHLMNVNQRQQQQLLEHDHQRLKNTYDKDIEFVLEYLKDYCLSDLFQMSGFLCLFFDFVRECNEDLFLFPLESEDLVQMNGTSCSSQPQCDFKTESSNPSPPYPNNANPSSSSYSDFSLRESQSFIDHTNPTESLILASVHRRKWEKYFLVPSEEQCEQKFRQEISVNAQQLPCRTTQRKDSNKPPNQTNCFDRQTKFTNEQFYSTEDQKRGNFSSNDGIETENSRDNQSNINSKCNKSAFDARGVENKIESEKQFQSEFENQSNQYKERFGVYFAEIGFYGECLNRLLLLAALLKRTKKRPECLNFEKVLFMRANQDKVGSWLVHFCAYVSSRLAFMHRIASLSTTEWIERCQKPHKKNNWTILPYHTFSMRVVLDSLRNSKQNLSSLAELERFFCFSYSKFRLLKHANASNLPQMSDEGHLKFGSCLDPEILTKIRMFENLPQEYIDSFFAIQIESLSSSGVSGSKQFQFTREQHNHQHQLNICDLKQTIMLACCSEAFMNDHKHIFLYMLDNVLIVHFEFFQLLKDALFSLLQRYSPQTTTQPLFPYRVQSYFSTRFSHHPYICNANQTGDGQFMQRDHNQHLVRRYSIDRFVNNISLRYWLIEVCSLIKYNVKKTNTILHANDIWFALYYNLHQLIYEVFSKLSEFKFEQFVSFLCLDFSREYHSRFPHQQKKTTEMKRFFIESTRYYYFDERMTLFENISQKVFMTFVCLTEQHFITCRCLQTLWTLFNGSVRGNPLRELRIPQKFPDLFKFLKEMMVINAEYHKKNQFTHPNDDVPTRAKHCCLIEFAYYPSPNQTFAQHSAKQPNHKNSYDRTGFETSLEKFHSQCCYKCNQAMRFVNNQAFDFAYSDTSGENQRLSDNAHEMKGVYLSHRKQIHFTENFSTTSNPQRSCSSNATEKLYGAFTTDTGLWKDLCGSTKTYRCIKCDEIFRYPNVYEHKDDFKTSTDYDHHQTCSTKRSSTTFDTMGSSEETSESSSNDGVDLREDYQFEKEQHHSDEQSCDYCQYGFGASKLCRRTHKPVLEYYKLLIYLIEVKKVESKYLNSSERITMLNQLITTMLLGMMIHPQVVKDANPSKQSNKPPGTKSATKQKRKPHQDPVEFMSPKKNKLDIPTWKPLIGKDAHQFNDNLSKHFIPILKDYALLPKRWCNSESEFKSMATFLASIEVCHSAFPSQRIAQTNSLASGPLHESSGSNNNQFSHHKDKKHEKSIQAIKSYLDSTTSENLLSTPVSVKIKQSKHFGALYSENCIPMCISKNKYHVQEDNSTGFRSSMESSPSHPMSSFPSSPSPQRQQTNKVQHDTSSSCHLDQFCETNSFKSSFHQNQDFENKEDLMDIEEDESVLNKRKRTRSFLESNTDTHLTKQRHLFQNGTTLRSCSNEEHQTLHSRCDANRQTVKISEKLTEMMIRNESVIRDMCLISSQQSKELLFDLDRILDPELFAVYIREPDDFFLDFHFDSATFVQKHFPFKSFSSSSVGRNKRPQKIYNCGDCLVEKLSTYSPCSFTDDQDCFRWEVIDRLSSVACRTSAKDSEAAAAFELRSNFNVETGVSFFSSQRVLFYDYYRRFIDTVTAKYLRVSSFYEGFCVKHSFVKWVNECMYFCFQHPQRCESEQSHTNRIHSLYKMVASCTKMRGNDTERTYMNRCISVVPRLLTGKPICIANFNSTELPEYQEDDDEE